MGGAGVEPVQSFKGVIGDKLDDVMGVGGGFKRAHGVFEFVDTNAVDFVHQRVVGDFEIGIDRVCQGRGQDDRLRAGGLRRFVAAIIQFVSQLGVGGVPPTLS